MFGAGRWWRRRRRRWWKWCKYTTTFYHVSNQIFHTFKLVNLKFVSNLIWALLLRFQGGAAAEEVKEEEAEEEEADMGGGAADLFGGDGGGGGDY